MEDEDLGNDPLETILDCVAYGKLLCALKGSSSLLKNAAVELPMRRSRRSTRQQSSEWSGEGD